MHVLMLELFLFMGKLTAQDHRSRNQQDDGWSHPRGIQELELRRSGGDMKAKKGNRQRYRRNDAG